MEGIAEELRCNKYGAVATRITLHYFLLSCIIFEAYFNLTPGQISVF